MMRSVGTLTRADLAETINRKMGFSRAESLDLVEDILAKMCGAMSSQSDLAWRSRPNVFTTAPLPGPKRP